MTCENGKTGTEVGDPSFFHQRSYVLPECRGVWRGKGRSRGLMRGLLLYRLTYPLFFFFSSLIDVFSLCVWDLKRLRVDWGEGFVGRQRKV